MSAVVIPRDIHATFLAAYAVAQGFDPVVVTLDGGLIGLMASDGAAWWAVEDSDGAYGVEVSEAYRAWSRHADIGRRVSLPWPLWSERILQAANAAKGAA